MPETMNRSFEAVRELFNRQFVAKTLLDIRRCPKCRHSFSSQYQKNTVASRTKNHRPFLLSCGHNICENCIDENRQNLACYICLKPCVELEEVALESSMSKGCCLRKYFDLNLYLLGEQFHLRYYTTYSGKNSINCIENASSIYICQECDTASSAGICLECKVLYCQQCFRNVHSNGKVLRSHALSSIGKAQFVPIEPKQCQKHCCTCEMCCNKCFTLCCLKCAKIYHKGHPVKRLSEMNAAPSVCSNFDNLLAMVDKAYEDLKSAQKNIKVAEMNLEDFAQQAVDKISNYFLELHSFLQLEEKRIITNFYEKCLEPQQKIRETQRKLGSSFKVVDCMRKSLQRQQNSTDGILLKEVIQKYTAELQLHQLDVQVSKITTNPFVFQVKRNFRDDFSQYIRTDYIDPQLTVHFASVYVMPPLNESGKNMPTTITAINMDTSLVFSDVSNNSNHFGVKKRHHSGRNMNTKKKTTRDKDVIALALLDRRQGEGGSISGLGLGIDGHCHVEHSAMDTSVTDGINAVTTTVATVNSITAAATRSALPMARITNVLSPEHFYIQWLQLADKLRELSTNYVERAHYANMMRTPTVGTIYMTYNELDKLWYRSMLLKLLPNEQFEVFLVDVGLSRTMKKHEVREINEQSTFMPFAAMRCALHGLQPVGNVWNDVAKQLLIEMTQNKPVSVSIVAIINSSQCNIVDIFTTHTSEVFSIRDAFLYTGMAREKPDAVMKAQIKISPIVRNNRLMPLSKFCAGQSFMVKVLYIESPHEFYVVQLDQCGKLSAMQTKLNESYGSETATPHEQLFWATVGQWCAVHIDNHWHRASVEELQAAEGAGHIGLRLVDSGKCVVVLWRMMYALEPQFMHYHAFAIRCQLADVQPLRTNNYTWTAEGVCEFTQITTNPSLQMTVDAVAAESSQPHTVTLHVCRRDIDVNVGEVLAKYGHCKWTSAAPFGATSQRPLNASPRPFKKASPPALSDACEKQLAMVTRPDDGRARKRTPIKVVHVVHPGEFYIEILSLRSGIAYFHDQMQTAAKAAAAQIDVAESGREWFLGDHCFIYTAMGGSVGFSSAARAEGTANKLCQWQRGTITSIEYDVDPESPFVVFLRDIGATVHGVSRAKLRTIGSEWSHVADAVIRCHLASIEPTGGMKRWSSSAIERFNHWVELFTQLSVTLHGSRAADTNSLPVLLWGTTVDTKDPLAPSISKHSSINRMLVNAGLAHLVESMDRPLQQDHTEGEITMDEWHSRFDDKALLQAIKRAGALNDSKANPLPLDDSESITHELEVHLNDVDMTPTTPLLKAPAAWQHPLPIEKTIIAGCVTYVDYACNVYLHDMDDETLLAKMAAKIKSEYGKAGLLDQDSPELVYGPGQACLVRYHLDKKFYRGIVMQLNQKAKYDIYLIDYGNTESVFPSALRPYAPFPKLPATASKFRIANIWPKLDQNHRFSARVLDQIHDFLVGEKVSVRVPVEELSRPIKACEFRVNHIDLADFLIRNDLVSATPPPETVPLASFDSDLEVEESVISIDYETLTTRADREEEEVKRQERAEKAQKMRDVMISEESNKGDDDYYSTCTGADDNEDAYNAHLNDRFKKLMECHDMPIPQGEETIPTKSVHLQQPSTSTRIFQMLEYSTLPNPSQYAMRKELQMLQDPVNESFSVDPDPLQQDNSIGGNISMHIDSDEDDNELQQSFASLYWHTSSEHKEEATEPKEREQQLQQQQQQSTLELSKLEASTNFKENFSPDETSSVFTHFSGIDRIKQGQLPYGRGTFRCNVVFIASSTNLYILPHLFDNEFRDVELQRLIAHVIKRCKPLTQFEHSAVCLARYTVDHKWYRALIRSYNPAAETVDVFYADYLNSESLPITAIRECPQEVLKCPQRTIMVRLHGLQPNPRMRGRDICRQLEKLCAKRPLVAKIIKRYDSHTDIDRRFTEELLDIPSKKTNITEIELYESETAKLPIYESLVQQNYYSRI